MRAALGKKSHQRTTRDTRLPGKLFLAVLIVGTVLTVYLLWARPHQLHWGAAAEEIQQTMPGDELIGDPDFLAIRAITIEGTPEEIWPWLIQMGWGRAGYYGYDLLENLGSPGGLPSAERVLTEHQNYRRGDEVPISQFFSLTFAAVEENHYLIWSSLKGEDPGAFIWALYPQGEKRTRLISRIGWRYQWDRPASLPMAVFTEFTDHLAVRKILQGVKGRVEGQIEPFWRQNLDFGLLVGAWLGFVSGLVLLLWKPVSRGGVLASFLAGISWLLVWYAWLPLWAAGMLTLLTAALLGWAYRKRDPG